MQVPYLVVGCGGHGILPVKPGPNRRPVRTPLVGRRHGHGPSDHSLRQYFNGFGHALVTATNRVLTIDLIGTKTQSAEPVGSGRLSNPAPVAGRAIFVIPGNCTSFFLATARASLFVSRLAL